MTTKQLVYGNGLPFTSPLDKCLCAQLDRIDQKRASCILIDGAVGLGKTTLATEALDYLNQKKGLGECQLLIKNHPQLALGGKDFASCFRKISKLPYPALAYDEAGDFNRRGAITQFNQMINRIFETYRGFKKIVIIILPNMNALDNHLFENQIPRFLIHIKRRNMNYADFQVYSLAQMNWIRFWFDKLSKANKHKCYSLVKPNFYGHFMNLPRSRDMMLDRLSTRGKAELYKQTEKELRGYVTYQEIAEKLGKSVIWVRKKVAGLGIKEKQIIDKAKVFDKQIISTLIELRREP